MLKARDILASFDLASLPNLDVAVLGALELLSDSKLPTISLEYKKPLVVGSGNAHLTGQIIFSNQSAYFADESSYQKVLDQADDVDGAVLISASGGKHAVGIAENLKEQGIETTLFTNNKKPAAAAYLDEDKILTFPKNREPYTYNTSTYLSMIFAQTGEDAAALLNFLESEVKPKLLRNFSDYSAFAFIVPPAFALVREMYRTKFDELFGPHLIGRIFTSEEIKHAKTVVSSGDELFVSFGEANEHYGLAKNRLHLPLPKKVDCGAMVAIGYYLIAQIQKNHPPYFKDNIENYTKQASEIFGQTIKPIVE